MPYIYAYQLFKNVGKGMVSQEIILLSGEDKSYKNEIAELRLLGTLELKERL